MPPWFASRSTPDLLILVIAGAIGITVVSFSVWLGVLLVTQPERDVTTAATALAGILNTMVGLLAGFLAGRLGRTGQKVEDENKGGTP